MRATYSDDLLQEINRLWLSKKTAGEIALMLDGMNRNKVMGIVHRARAIEGEDKWPRRDPAGKNTNRPRKTYPKRARRAPQTRVEPVWVPKVVAEPFVPPVRPPLTDMVLFGTRRWNQCSWIEGEPTEDAMCCGAKTVRDGSWCAYHKEIVYREPRLTVGA